MNTSVFNTQENPLYVMDSSGGGYFTAVRLGDAYITTGNSTDLVAVGNFFVLSITNPSDSGNNVFIQTISVVSSGVNLFGQVIIAKGNTTVTGASAPTSFVNANLALDTSRSHTQIEMATQSTSPGGTSIETASQVASIFTNTYSGGLLVAPNTKLTIFIENTFSVATSMYIKVNFWEARV